MLNAGRQRRARVRPDWHRGKQRGLNRGSAAYRGHHRRRRAVRLLGRREDPPDVGAGPASTCWRHLGLEVA